MISATIEVRPYGYAVHCEGKSKTSTAKIKSTTLVRTLDEAFNILKKHLIDEMWKDDTVTDKDVIIADLTRRLEHSLTTYHNLENRYRELEKKLNSINDLLFGKG